MRVTIHPSGPLGGYLRVPPSKNYTLRLLLGAALAEGRSLVRDPATNDDARALVRCLRALGAGIEEQGPHLAVTGFAGRPASPGALNPGNAGAVLRMLLGTACLCEDEVRFETDYPESLGKRPNEDLLRALRRLGAEARGQGPDGRLPIVVAGGRARMRGGHVTVSGANSSQFLSSLLYLTPHLDGATTIEVRDEDDAPRAGGPALVSAPLIDQTLEALGRLGLAVDASGDGLLYTVPGGQVGRSGELEVNGDWPSAAALMAAVAVAGGMCVIHGLRADCQGEARAEQALAAMGTRFNRPGGDGPFNGGLTVHSKGDLTALRFNGDLATDAVLALVGAACVAQGTSRFEGIANLRLKECDRISEPLAELARLGVVGREGPDWLEIDGNPAGYEGGIEVDSRGDHRVAQLLAIVALRCMRPVTILRAEHIGKSYPTFFEDLQSLGVHLHMN